MVPPARPSVGGACSRPRRVGSPCRAHRRCYHFANSSWTFLLDDVSDEGQLTPTRRYLHTVLLREDRWLVIYGGVDKNGNILSDSWMVDLDAYPLRWLKLTFEPDPEMQEHPHGRAAPLVLPWPELNSYFMYGGKPAYGNDVLDELWSLDAPVRMSEPMGLGNEFIWQMVREDQKEASASSGKRVYRGYWLGADRKMRQYIDVPEARAWAGGIASGGCNSDACTNRLWLVGGYTLDNVLGDVWTLEKVAVVVLVGKCSAFIRRIDC